jgi:gliding motility-associated-like protein
MKSTDRFLSGFLQKIQCLLTGCFILFTHFVFAQSGTVNIGFESGNFNGWSAFTGQCCPVNTPNAGIDPTRHFITSGSGTDTLSQGLITEVAPGSVYSARLGNADNLAEGEAFEYTFAVPSDSLILNIRFAVLLEDGLHPVSKQPRFNYQVTTGSGQSLQGCTDTEVLAGTPYPGKMIFGTLEILPWQTRSINLTGMVGQVITIRFETGDCGPGGHFGYAYIDCDLISSEIIHTACNPDGSILLQVHSGLNGSWFNGDTSDSIQIQHPIHGTSYFYELNPGFGCSFAIATNRLDSILPAAFFTYEHNCDQLISFLNLSTNQSGSLYSWDFGDAQTSNLSDPHHMYSSTGNYNTTLTVVQPNMCRASNTQPVTIEEQLLPVLDKPDIACTDEFFYMKIIAPFPVITCNWEVGNNNLSGITVAGSSPTNGDIPIIVSITDSAGCEYFLTDEIIVNDCVPKSEQAFIPSAFSPNGDGINDIFIPVVPSDAAEIKLNIFNRYGQVISNRPEWNGQFHRTQAPIGVYSYKLSFLLNGKTHFQTGTLSLVR